MKAADIRKIRRKVEKTLDNKHFEHTLGVAYTASALAMCYQVDIVKAQTAGLLHDCAKGISDEKKIIICEKHNIQMNDVEKKSPYLLHAKVGSFLAMKKYNINDHDIINAILNHTTGRPGMSLLEKIIYVADYIEPMRKQAPNLTAVRKTAFQDIDKALLMILQDTLRYLESIHVPIDSMTVKTFDYYSSMSSIKQEEN